ncbi:MAG: flagellar hook-associated protein FlgL [Desulfobacteraceae bacterium]|nr:flagellar hook-associated protein FlgL [Desulfobacteraceae bacterium]
MRVTMSTIYNQITTDLNRLTDKINKTNESISSGKIYSVPSDNPVALTQALAIRNNISDTAQYKQNISYGQSWVTATDTAMSQVQDALTQAKTLALQGANDTQSAASRQAIAAEVKTILEDVVALGNTKIGDRYVFGGAKTTGYGTGQSPFVLQADNSVTYNGDQGGISIQTASGLNQKINIDGHTALVAGGVFDNLKSLYNGLMSNSQTDIETAASALDSSISYISGQSGVIGATANTLTNNSSMADSLTLIYQGNLSDIEDTDTVKAIADLQTQETSYQAALGAAAKVMSVSLADYLK